MQAHCLYRVTPPIRRLARLSASGLASSKNTIGQSARADGAKLSLETEEFRRVDRTHRHTKLDAGTGRSYRISLSDSDIEARGRMAGHQIDVSKGTPRLPALDIVRGAVMVLMAIDHVRVYSGVPAGGPTAGIFFTRWVTHFCAPAFAFLAGTSAFLYGLKLGLPRRRGKARARWRATW